MNENSYNKEEAVHFITDRLLSDYKQLAAEVVKSFVERALVLDEGYMEEMGFFDYDLENNNVDLIYDEEDAFNYILSDLVKDPEYKKLKSNLLEDLIDDFLENKYDYLLSKGLVD